MAQHRTLNSTRFIRLAIAAALQLATRLNQRAIYDSHYLALAQALNCEFWTADERFYRSASPNLANIRLISEAAAPNQ